MMTDSKVRLTKPDLEMLRLGLEMAHAGGFYTADRREWQRCERLREAGLLKFWNGRRSRFWSSQFFDLTEAGRAAFTSERKHD
jgi:hypothetical protein